MSNFDEVIDNDGLIALMKHADESGKNRRAEAESIIPYLEDGGVHICTVRLCHNECEWRAYWMVRVKTEMPMCSILEDDGAELGMIQVWLDTDFDVWDSTVKTWNVDYERTFGA